MYYRKLWSIKRSPLLSLCLIGFSSLPAVANGVSRLQTKEKQPEIVAIFPFAFKLKRSLKKAPKTKVSNKSQDQTAYQQNVLALR